MPLCRIWQLSLKIHMEVKRIPNNFVKGEQIWRSHTIFSSVFFFCYVANYYRFISLKQKAFTVSQLHTSWKSIMAPLVSLVRHFSQSWNQGVLQFWSQMEHRVIPVTLNCIAFFSTRSSLHSLFLFLDEFTVLLP